MKMTILCLFCKKVCTNNPDLTFHIFPSDQIIRRQWFQAIGRELEETTFIYLCSNHFSKDNFMEQICGRRMQRFLKNNAVPVIHSGGNQQEIFEKPPSVPQPSTVVPVSNPPRIPTKKQKYSTQTLERPSSTSSTKSVNSSINLSTIEVHPSSVMERMEDASQSSASTNSASEPEHGTEPVSQKKRRYRKPRFFGDCDELDMHCPKRALRNWRVAKKTIDRQRKKIQLLQGINRRIKSRVTCLQSLLAYIRSEFNIKKSESVIKESIPRSAAGVMRNVKRQQLHSRTSDL